MKSVSVKARYIFISMRFSLEKIIKRLLLGSIAGGAPFTVIRSLDESYYDDIVKKHIIDRRQIYKHKIDYYNFPESYPLQFRRNKSFEQRFVFLLNDVIASPRTGAIWLPEGKMLQESVGSLGRVMGWGGSLQDTCLTAKKISTEDEIICCPPTGYYHWLLEVTPNLANAVNIYPNVRILLPTSVPGYIMEALELLLGSEFKSRLIISDVPVRIIKMVMPQIEAYSGFVRLEDIEILRKAFLCKGETGSNHNNRIYVSRSRATKRRIGNEKEVEKILSQNGIEIVYPEELTFTQQINLFANAKEIIAPHGAGLANLVWAKSSARVLEIFPHNFFNDCFARLSMSRSLSYDYFSCQADAKSNGKIEIQALIAKLNVKKGQN